MIGKTISHYKILEKLGEGGMGVVYKAEDTKLKRVVALKFLPKQVSLDETEKKRFIHEARAAAALDHPNICSIYEINETDDGQLYIVMACYEGESLKEKIEKGPLEIEEAQKIVQQAAEGLKQAHKQEIVHRDIKPANIFLTSDGLVKILDFGLAKLRGQTRLTKTGTTLGTVAYMSPEQAQGDKVDHRSDIWSLGVLLYEMLTGELPFKGEYDQAVLYSILNETPQPVTDLRSEIPISIEQVVNKALEKNPGKRYQNIETLLDDLRSISEGIVPEKIKTRLRNAKLRKRKKIILYAAMAVLIITAVTVLSLLTKRANAIDSIAVLPLKNLTGDAEQQYFVDGVTDELIGQLGQVSGLRRVISRTSVMRYKETDKSLSDIARELNVDAVVEGTVYQAGDNVRIRFQLIDVLPEERNLWGHTYEQSKSDIRMMYSEVTRAVADKIKVSLTEEERTRFASIRKVNSKAYDAYLKGMFHWRKLTPEGFDMALQYYELAREEDPASALGYIGIAMVWVGRNQFGLAPPSEAVPKAKKAALKALELDNALADVHFVLALVRAWGEWAWEEAEKSFLRALELNPNNPDCRAYYSHYLFFMRHPEEALAQIERAMELDPFNPMYQSLYGVDLLFVRRYDDALEQLRKVLSMVPNHAFTLHKVAVAFHQKRMYEEALETMKAFFAAENFKQGVTALTRGYKETGYTGAMNRAAEAWEEHSRVANATPWEIADVYVFAGNKDKALELLEKGFEVHDPNMPYIVAFPEFVDLLGNEPRFQELLRKMNLPTGK